jgi:hypothetical protein
MGRRADLSARALFGEGLLRHLRPDGWEPLDVGVGRAGPLVALSKPLSPDFAAVAELEALARGDGGRIPVDIFRLNVGVSYEPLRCLWPLLGQDFAGALVSEDASRLLGVPRPRPEIVDSPDQARRVIDELALLVPPAAALIAERFTNIGALLTELRLNALKKAALLAATGEFDAAAKTLSGFVPVPGVPSQLRIEEQNTIDQLNAWIEMRDPSNLAAAPVFRPPVIPPTPPLRRRIPVVLRAAWHWRRYRR